MASLSPKRTGLPFVVWILVRGQAQHDVRIKLSQTLQAEASELTSVGVRPFVHIISDPDDPVSPKMSSADFSSLSRWIRLNLEVLIQYWDSEIDTADAIERLQSISQG